MNEKSPGNKGSNMTQHSDKGEVKMKNKMYII